MLFTHDVAPRMALVMDLVNTDPGVVGAVQPGVNQPSVATTRGTQPGTGKSNGAQTDSAGSNGTQPGEDNEDVVDSPGWLQHFVADHCLFRVDEGSMKNGRTWNREIKELRAELRAIVDAPDMESAVERTNSLIAVLSVRPYLSRHDDLDWHIDWAADSADAVSRIRVEAGLGLLGFLPQGGIDRFRRCARPGCERYLVDLSKNKSRKFCEGTNCAARTHAQAYRNRNKQG
ncbi:CGNR zinc finger domain-containing protein [Corynebacterium auriscanis]|uniref:CGNR zinc finger domain-containing protein n=1 Tax=Corynebacterium auriscanis TaxID=99807 RepID=UPI00068CCC6D|nr:CGNR zinc finger domain-containing protein [Corynebacterium auriscanis]WJY73452.1 CGNR zinc finger [Corynebacterium auriscanis]